MSDREFLEVDPATLHLPGGKAKGPFLILVVGRVIQAISRPKQRLQRTRYAGR